MDKILLLDNNNDATFIISLHDILTMCNNSTKAPLGAAPGEQ